MINYLYFIIIAICLLIFIFFIIILINYGLIYRREKDLKERKEQWEAALFAYLEGSRAIACILKQVEGRFSAFRNFLEPYLDNLRGDELDKLNRVANRSGLVDYYLARLAKGSRREKIDAAIILAKLNEPRAIMYLERMLYTADESLILVAAQSLAKMDDINLVVPILRVLFARTYFTYEGLAQLLTAYGEKICPILIKFIEEWDSKTRDLEATFGVEAYKVVTLFIDVLGHYNYLAAVDIFADLLKQNQATELLIHIFKALVKIEMPIEIDLKPFLEHQNMVVRSQAARYVGVIGDESYISQLKVMLSDQFWWAKYYAAESLVKLDQLDLLKEIANSNSEGAKICKYILSF